MTGDSVSLTSTDMIAAASEMLSLAGYRRATDHLQRWNTVTSRLFEDEYNVVGIVVFETCNELIQTWPDLQGSLVKLMSEHVGQGEGKSWDGYLVLLTSGVATSQEAELESIRYNTARLRKIVGTGDELRSITDVRRILRPLLPLEEVQAAVDNASALDVLPGLLAVQGIAEETTRLLVEAFRDQAPLIERLHTSRENQA